MEDVRRWPLLSLLDNDFVDRITSCIVFGSAGCASLILTRDDELYALGMTSCSCLGVGSSTSFEPVLVEAMTGRLIRQLACGSGPHILAVSEAGEVYAWGHNSHGQLGLGNTCCSRGPTVVLGALSGQRVQQIACGANHSAALTDRGELFTWGLNSSGQLGLGSIINEGSPRQVPLHNRFLKAVCCGHKCTMVLTESGEVYAWGCNEHGQVGSGNEGNHLSPYLVVSLAKHAVITQGTLFVWGNNNCGQLGCSLLRKKQLDPVESGRELGGISDIAAANSCNITVVANKHGKVFMWGNVRGQTVAGAVETRFSRVDDVFASFASPPVSARMLGFGEKTQRPLVEALRAAFDDPATSDLKLIVEGRTIHVHKALLKMRCEYFRNRLGIAWSEANGNQIEIGDFPYSTYRAFLQWLYTDELQVDLDEALCNDEQWAAHRKHAAHGSSGTPVPDELWLIRTALLELANCYCEKELKRRCALLVSRTTSVDNAAGLFAAALRHDVPILEEHAFHFCLMHMTSVTLSESFAHMDGDALKRLVTRAAKAGVFKR